MNLQAKELIVSRALFIFQCSAYRCITNQISYVGWTETVVTFLVLLGRLIEFSVSTNVKVL